MATIVHLSTIHPRGDARILVRQAQTLAAHLPAHRVILMIADGKGDVRGGAGEVSILDLGDPGSRLKRALIAPWRAFAAVRRLRAAVVHFHDPELIAVGILLRCCGYAVIYDVHEDVPKQVLTKHWIPAIIRWPVAWAAQAVEWFAARIFTAVVPATGKIGERFPRGKTVTIQNYPVLDELVQEQRLPYEARDAVFVYPGALAEVRGITELVDAMARLRALTARLDLAGYFSPAAYGDVLSRRPGWSKVRFHGEVSRQGVADLLAGARAGLVVHQPIPNEVDAQPIKTFEYMSVGLPVIASDFPAWRAIIEPAQCGLLVDPTSPDAIAGAMQWILDHPQEARQMGERGRQAAIQTYNWQPEGEKLVALYRRILEPC